MRVVLNVGPDERQLGIFLTGVSRVRKLTDLALQVPIDQERLERVVNHSALPFRKNLDAKFAWLEEEKLLPLLGEMLGVPAGDALEELRRVMLPRLREL